MDFKQKIRSVIASRGFATTLAIVFYAGFVLLSAFIFAWLCIFLIRFGREPGVWEMGLLVFMPLMAYVTTPGLIIGSIAGVAGVVLAYLKRSELKRFKKRFYALSGALLFVASFSMLTIQTKDYVVEQSIQTRVMGKDETIDLMDACSINYLELTADNQVKISYDWETDKKAQRADPNYWADYLAKAKEAGIQNRCDFIIKQKGKASNIPVFLGYWHWDDLGSPQTKMDIPTAYPGVLVAWNDSRPDGYDLRCIVYTDDIFDHLATYELVGNTRVNRKPEPPITYRDETVLSRSALDKIIQDHCGS